MKLKILVGLCGRARHGKDFAANVMKKTFEEHGLRCFLSSVSEDVLLEAKFLGLVPIGLSRAELGRKELDALVALGHDAREKNEDYWITRLEARIGAIVPDVALIPGIRFLNEVDWIRRSNGLVVKVRRHNVDGASMFICQDRDPNDAMETCVDRIQADYEINAATGQESWLEAQAKALAEEILWKR